MFTLFLTLKNPTFNTLLQICNHITSISSKNLITSLASSGALPPLFDLLKSLLTRHSLRSVTLEIDGDKLEVKGVSTQEQKRLIDAWMSRHKLILTAGR